ISVGDISGSQSAGLLLAGPSTITRDVLVLANSTGANTIGGASPDTQTFANNVTLANTNSATILTADPGGTVNYAGLISGPGAVSVQGGTTVFSTGTTAAYLGATSVDGGTLNIPVGASLTNSSIVNVNGGTLNANGTVT